MTSNQLGDANELARRFVACKGWRWLPGMLTMDGWRVYDACGGLCDLVNVDSGILDCKIFGTLLPDLSDAATRGAIFQLVREAWGDQQAYAIGFRQDVSWTVTLVCPVTDEQFWFDGATEAEALLAALEAAKAGGQ
jgi:hypothetical protein